MNGSPVRCVNRLTISSWPFIGCVATTVWMRSSISLPRVLTYSGVTSQAPTPWIGAFTLNYLTYSSNWIETGVVGALEYMESSCERLSVSLMAVTCDSGVLYATHLPRSQH